jgi:DNA-binding response OmpR family regulator
VSLETFVRVLILEDDKELAHWLLSAFTTAIGATDVFSTIEDAEAALDAFHL